jgi:acetylornithine deacetylase
MAKVLSALERYQREVATTLPEHALCGRPSLSVGTIHGGISVNTVPDRATIEIDRRLTPGEQPQAAYRQVINFVARECGEDWPIEHDEPFITSRPLGERDNGALAEGLAAAARRGGIDSRIVGVPYGTNAAAFSAAGVPSVVFGPGSIDQAHTADEWIELGQVERACEVIYEFCRGS